MKKNFTLLVLLAEIAYGNDTVSTMSNTSFLYILLAIALATVVFAVYIIFNKKARAHTTDHLNVKEKDSRQTIEEYRIQTQKIPLENQPFRLSGMLHVLTNKISGILKENHQTIYYDIDKSIGRYIVGDNDYIEQVLEILVQYAASYRTGLEIIIHISKHKEASIVFDVNTPQHTLDKSELKRYLKENEADEELSDFVKAKQIAKAMQGSVQVKSNKSDGTHYIFTIPFIKDEKDRSKQSLLIKVLNGKRILFVSKSALETKLSKDIFETYNTKFNEMSLDEFNKKRPGLHQYDIIVLYSSYLTLPQIAYLKKMHDDKNNQFKFIVIHDLFESDELINRSKEIADAEIYSPMIRGDVEEILYQVFIQENKAVKGINNIEIFDPKTFIIQSHKNVSEDDLKKFSGARIAVVEDSKVDQRVMRNILKVEGITLYCLNNGKEMIDLLNKEPIDLIFSDINMPVMDGLTMTKEIRSEPKWKNIPIISISSMVFPHEIKAMQSAGFSASISKPIVTQDVYKALEKFIDLEQIQTRENTASSNTSSSKPQIRIDDFDPKVLNVKAALAQTKNRLEYRELLEETLDLVKDTPEQLRQLVKEGDTNELKKFSKSMTALYTNIHAGDLVKMFTEMTYYISKHNTSFLQEYVLLYRKKLKRLEEEANKFFEMTQNEVIGGCRT